jgi:hypothetical protein
LKFEFKTPWSTARWPKKPKKTQKGHLEEGKSQKAANDTKSGKAKQNGKEELGNDTKSDKAKQNSKEEIEEAQKSKKSSKLKQKLKMNTPPEINSP